MAFEDCDNLLPLEVPSAEPFDAPLVCFPVNEEWRKIVLGALELLIDPTAWDTLDLDEIQRAIASVKHIQAEIGSASECTVPMVQHDIVKAEHHASVNVAGGATVANAWTQLPITRIVQDLTGVVTLSANTLTLPAGKWRFTASHFFRDSTGVQGRIRVTFAPVAFPLAEFHYYSLNARNVGDIELCPSVNDYFNLGEDFTVKMFYRVNAAEATNGLGFPLNIGTEDERYGEIMLERFTLVES